MPEAKTVSQQEEPANRFIELGGAASRKPPVAFFPTARWLKHPDITPEKQPLLSDFSGRFASFGSCFALNLKRAIEPYGFRFWFNGDICAHYSTESIADALERVSGRLPERNVGDGLYYFSEQEIYAYRYFFKRRFFGADAVDQVRNKIAEVEAECHAQVRRAKFIVITLGTSRVVRMRSNSDLIHTVLGLPVDQWYSDLLSMDDNVRNLKRIVDAIGVIRNGEPVKIILTISPQRYVFGLRTPGVDGNPFVDNVLSKSILRVAIHQFQSQFPDCDSLYFPSFEMVMEGLRSFEPMSHYDFTHIEQTHTPQYVVKRFLKAYCSENLLAQFPLVELVNATNGTIGEMMDEAIRGDDPRILKILSELAQKLRAAPPPSAPGQIAGLKAILRRVCESAASAGQASPEFSEIVSNLYFAMIEAHHEDDPAKAKLLELAAQGVMSLS
ncbi:MAG: GSCFA domain-containing protein [Alphaproteobacteria bacterium]|nr:GSCFA domain-containing protein [Alphaproteobacteria bacterium]